MTTWRIDRRTWVFQERHLFSDAFVVPVLSMDRFSFLGGVSGLPEGVLFYVYMRIQGPRILNISSRSTMENFQWRHVWNWTSVILIFRLEWTYFVITLCCGFNIFECVYIYWIGSFGYIHVKVHFIFCYHLLFKSVSFLPLKLHQALCPGSIWWIKHRSSEKICALIHCRSWVSEKQNTIWRLTDLHVATDT